jgi:D-serine deaminase-like pyridoxal phosphate-dependent protein
MTTGFLEKAAEDGTPQPDGHSSALSNWHRVSNVADIESPSLMLYIERIEQNIERMIRIAGGVDRLRPHMKTHKLPELIQRQRAKGIEKFKCATIAEAEMVADCGARDVLIAYQPVGPNARRLCALIKRFPETRFSAVADDESVLRELSRAAQQEKVTVKVLIDIDCGQHRTGVEAGSKAIALYKALSSLPGLKPAGLHAYDGHIHERDVKARSAECERAFAPVRNLREQLVAAGMPVPRLIAGGTPTFPMHAARKDVECSPGTCVLWDFGYSTNLPDLDFLPAALLLTRVVSKPGENRLCLDLGHKAVASEGPHPRVHLIELPEAKFVAHNEEHLVVETERAASFAVGDALYGIPWHVCPTVALHSEAIAVTNGRATDRWKVVGRARRLTI